MFSLKRSSPVLLWLLISLFFWTFASATSVTPSPEQISAFQSLSPAQQQQLASQFGIQLNGAKPSQPQANSVPVSTVNKRADSHNGDNGAAIGDLAQTRVEHRNDKEVQFAEGGLKPFGYDLFAGEPTTYEPVSDVPVSADYILGVGDSLRLQLYGKENQNFEIQVDAEGQVHLPGLGPIFLMGMSFSEAKKEILSQVSKRKIGVKATISMGQLKAIRVFVLGEAYAPGSYVMSSLSTITNALVLSGGIAETGSLRNVQLKRRGKVVSQIDLYELLLQGDNSGDVQLKSGDVVFIPPVNSRVTLIGQVRRPAVYEIAEGETIENVIGFAGGFSERARLDLVRLERVGSDFRRTMSALDLTLGLDVALKAGDILSIMESPDQIDGSLTLMGHVVSPGDHPWFDGMKLSDLLPSDKEVLSKPDLSFGLIKRRIKETGVLEVFSFNLRDVFYVSASDSANFKLAENDTVMVFSTEESQTDASQNQKDMEQEPGRQELIGQLIAELRSNATAGRVSNEIEVTGYVKYPGVYPLTPNMHLAELLAAAGGLEERAYRLAAEVTRTSFTSSGIKKQQRVELNLNDPKSYDFKFEPKDVLQIRSLPEWAETQYVEISGEVRFPGVYPIHKSDLLRDVIRRAGGFTQYAHAQASVFTRESLRQAQQRSLDDMRQRLLDDVAKSTISEGQEAADVGSIERILTQLESGRALGRLVIDIEKVLTADAGYQVVLEDGDSLFVPAQKNAITVVGEVQMPVSQIFEKDLSFEDYIERSGGFTRSADSGSVYVIKADGSVSPATKSNWFASSSSPLDAGDTIVVPLDADRVNQRELWRDVSQIFYQMALGAAAVGSF